MEILNKTKKVNKGLLVFVFLLIIALLIFLIISLKLEQNGFDESGELNKTSQTEEVLDEESFLEGENILNEESLLIQEPLIIQGPETTLSDREDYLRKNITELSSIKEVLGGTFYITEIHWLDENSAQVKYEDGHIALEAEALFSNDVAPISFIATQPDLVVNE